MGCGACLEGQLGFGFGVVSIDIVFYAVQDVDMFGWRVDDGRDATDAVLPPVTWRADAQALPGKIARDQVGVPDKG